jgi:hypothetical protein
METFEFYLYKVKIFFNEQLPLLVERIERSTIFLEAIKSSSEVVGGKIFYWHIGNIEMADEYSGKFAIGRTTKTVLERYNKNEKLFVEEEYETSPYTIVLFDAKMEIVAIAKKTKLSPDTDSVARRLKTLLFSTQIIHKQNIDDIEIKSINDPEDFIEKLQKSYSIKSFTASFGRPNPSDPDELFNRPLMKYCSAANGTHGKTTLLGEGLNSDVLSGVTRSVAATGNDASAKIFETETTNPIHIKLRKNPKIFIIRSQTIHIEVHDALTLMKKAYKKIRGKNDTDN